MEMVGVPGPRTRRIGSHGTPFDPGPARRNRSWASRDRQNSL